MSSDPAVRANGLGKCYRIYPRPIDRLREVVSLRRRRYHSKFWALKDISFEIDRGETLGLVGMGNIAQKVVRRARRFDVNIQYYDRYASMTPAEVADMGVSRFP